MNIEVITRYQSKKTQEKISAVELAWRRMMTLKDFKFSETSKNLLENLDLWEELEDKTAETISGGAIFNFVNNTEEPIDVTLLSGGAILSETTISQSRLSGTQSVDIPGVSQITVQFDEIPGTEVNLVDRPMISTRRGIFELQEGKIEFLLG